MPLPLATIPILGQPPSFRYGDKTYEYSVRLLSRRKKTISIHVHPDASVEVKAPVHTSAQAIIELVKKRARWVVRQVEQMQQHHVLVLPREYVSGETHFYMGRRYVLKVVPSDIDRVKLTRGAFMIECRYSDAGYVKTLLSEWYKKHARIVFERRFAVVAVNVDWLRPVLPISVRHMKKQWGSCSPKGRISLNWNLVKAPVECIDYVITHEVCHLREHNHSKRFYALLDRHAENWSLIKSRLDGMAEVLLNG